MHFDIYIYNFHRLLFLNDFIKRIQNPIFIEIGKENEIENPNSLFPPLKIILK